MRKAVAALGVLASLAGMGAVASASSQPGQIAATSQKPTSIVHLLTGDSVLLSHNHVTLAPAKMTGPAPATSQITMNGRHYVFPGVVRRYLGRFIDPELFDVTRLAAAGTGMNTPVRIQYAAGATPIIPGLTITHREKGGATGYVSAAKAFRQALLVQWRADTKTGAPAPKSLLGGLAHLSLDAAAPPSVAKPHYPMRTLVIKALDASGKPADGVLVDLANTDTPGKFETLFDVDGGEQRISVPLGHYSLLGVGDLPDSTPHTSLQFVVPISDFTVTRDLQTVVIDARKATTTPSIRTPRPAGRSELSLTWARYAADKQLVTGDAWFFDTDQEVRVAPAGAAKVGRMDWETYWQLAGSSGSGRPYTYNLSFRDPRRVPTNQTHRVIDSQLARLNATYYDDGSDTAPNFQRIPSYPSGDEPGYAIFSLASATRHTEYILGSPGAVWTDVLYASPTDDNPFGGAVVDGARRYLPGSVRTADWLRAPSAPGFVDQTNGQRTFQCTACHTNSKLAVSLAQVTDTDRGHLGTVDPSPDGSPVTRFRLYENGKLVDDENDVTGGTFAVPTPSTKYRIVDQATRPWGGYTNTTQSTTDLSFSSAAGQGGRLPKGWDCTYFGTGRCTVLPILRATMPLPTDLTGTIPLGRSTATLSVGHIQGAPKLAITAAGVQTSLDHGRTWHQAHITRIGGGRFRIVLSNPDSAADQPLSLRITAKDAAGATITETVLNAARIANG